VFFSKISESLGLESTTAKSDFEAGFEIGSLEVLLAICKEVWSPLHNFFTG